MYTIECKMVYQVCLYVWLTRRHNLLILTSSLGQMALHLLWRMRWLTPPHFEGRTEYIYSWVKTCLQLVGLKPATFWLQASSLTTRPLISAPHRFKKLDKTIEAPKELTNDVSYLLVLFYFTTISYSYSMSTFSNI